VLLVNFVKKMLLTKTSASYADFVVVGMLHFFKLVDESLYERMVKTEPEFEKLYGACKLWLERDGN
jgi:hypothetical protein